jgi:hypothetical protein
MQVIFIYSGEILTVFGKTKTHYQVLDNVRVNYYESRWVPVEHFIAVPPSLQYMNVFYTNAVVPETDA